MDRSEAIEQIRVVVEKVLNREIPVLSADARLMEELNLDSTSVLEMLMDLEENAGFVVEVDDLEPSVFATVGSLADYLSQMTAVA